MTYTQLQRRKMADALTRSGEMRRLAEAETDSDTRRELVDAARDWVRHAERLANKMHARRQLQGVK